MIIIHDIHGAKKFETQINNGCKRRFELMKEDSVTLRFALADTIKFVRGDYIVLEAAPYNFVTKFVLFNDYQPKYNVNNGAYDYEITFVADYYTWAHRKLMLTTQKNGRYYRRETNWKLTADLRTHAEQIIYNLASIGKTYQLDVDTAQIDNSVKFVSYDNIDIISAMNQLCNEENFDCEWWVTGNVLHFGRLEIGNDANEDQIVYENAVNAESMERRDSVNKYANRLYVFGSTRNLPATYGKKVYLTITKVEDAFSHNFHGTQYHAYKVEDAMRKLSPESFATRAKCIVDSVCESSATDFVNQMASVSGNVATTTFTFSQGQLRLDGEYDFVPVGLEWGVTDASYQVNKHSGTIHLFAFSSDAKKHEIAKIGLSGEFKRIRLDPSVFKNGTVIKYQLVFDIDLPQGYSNLKYAVKVKGVCRTMHMTPYQDSTITVTTDGVTKEEARHNRPFVNNNGMLHFLLNTEPSTMNHYRSDDERYTDMYLLTTSQDAPKVGDILTFYEDVLNDNVPVSYYSMDNDEQQTTIGISENRLRLPGKQSYIQEGELQEDEVVEDVVIFDDIYPSEAGWTMAVTSRYVTDKTEFVDGSVATEEFPIYSFTNVQQFKFSERYMLPGSQLKVHFQSGIMAGLEFDVKFNPNGLPEKIGDSWNDKAQLFEIVRNEEYGRMLPDANLHPSDNDKYILLGFDTKYISTMNLVTDAENRLAERGRLELAKRKMDGSTYDVNLMSFITTKVRFVTADRHLFSTTKREAFYVMSNAVGQLPPPGKIVQIINPAWFDGPSHTMRILGFELDLAQPFVRPHYIVGQSHIKRRLQSIEDEIKKLKNTK